MRSPSSRRVFSSCQRLQWVRVDFSGTSVKVSLNGRTYIDMQDGRITGAGAVGMWTKADRVTVFDDFAFGAPQRK